MGIQLGKKINGGGTGAIHEGPNDTVYKITNGDPDANADLMNEFHTLSGINTIPGIAVQRVLEAGRHEGRCYMQFKRIHGESLGELLIGNRLNQGELIEIRSQIRSIHEKLGENGFYQGDPEGLGNYMITRTKEGPKVTLVDFVEGGSDPSGNTALQDMRTIDGILDRLIKNFEHIEADTNTLTHA